MGDLDVLHRDAAAIIAAWHDVMITVHLQAPTTAALDLTDKHEQRFVQIYPGGFYVLTVLVGSKLARDADPRMRARAAESAKRFAPHVREAVVVVEGSGLAVIMIRSVTTALSMIARHRLKVVSTVEEGVAWLAKQAEPGSLLAAQSAELLTEMLDLLGP